MDLAYLFDLPPDEYAAERRRLVHELIKSAPPEQREAMRETQRLIDASDSGDHINNLRFLFECMDARLSQLTLQWGRVLDVVRGAS